MLMAAAILIPLIGVSWVGINTLLEAEREVKLRSIQETVRATVLFIEREIAIAETALKNVANSQGLQSDDFERLHKLMSATRTTPYTWTLLSDYTGQPLFNTRIPYGSPLPTYQGKWASAVIDSQKTRVSGLFIGELSGRPAISIDVPAPLTSGKRYVVSQVFDASYFNRAFDAKSLGKDWIVGIFGADGVTIARNRNADVFVGKQVPEVLLSASKAQQDGVLRHVTREGIDVYNIYTRSELSAWTVAIGVPAAEIESAARVATLYTAASLAAILAVAIGMAAFLARKLASSLAQAANAARLLRQGVVPPTVGSNVVEIDVLLKEMHDTSLSLKAESEARALLQKEKDAMHESEQLARKRAEEQNQAKDELLAMLGHELRNPLSAVSAAIAVMDMPQVSHEKAARARAIAKRQTEHLARIVDELLDTRRVLSGQIELTRVPLDIGKIVRHAVETKRLSDHDMHRWHLEVESVWIKGDRTRVEQILDNLLHNAMKYTPEGGAIEVKCYGTLDEVMVVIRDTGIGISPDLLPTIFDVFKQGPTSIDRAKGGLGIGLAVVKHLTGMHGGEIEALSDGPGKGSTFTLRFSRSHEPGEVQENAHAVMLQPHPVRILLVEDSADARETLVTLLQSQGFEVLASIDGESAVDVATRELPDVMIVDIGLPGISGFEVARRLQSNPATRGIRLIALSGYGSEEDRLASANAGFAVHMTKPVAMPLLIESIGKEFLTKTS